MRIRINEFKSRLQIAELLIDRWVRIVSCCCCNAYELSKRCNDSTTRFDLLEPPRLSATVPRRPPLLSLRAQFRLSNVARWRENSLIFFRAKEIFLVLCLWLCGLCIKFVCWRDFTCW